MTGRHRGTFYHGYAIVPCRSGGSLHFHYGIPDKLLRLAMPVGCIGRTPLGLLWPVTIELAKLQIDFRMALAALKVG